MADVLDFSRVPPRDLMVPKARRVLLLVNDHEATAVVDSFHIHDRYVQVELADSTHITSVGHAFLRNCRHLVTLNWGRDTTRSGIVRLSHTFLYSCESLTSVDLSDLTNLTAIGGWAMSCSTCLTSVHFGEMADVTEIGEGLLAVCPALPSIDLSRSFAQLPEIGDRFLGECHGMTAVRLTGLTNVQVIGDDSCASVFV